MAWCLACATPRLTAQKGVREQYLFRALNASRTRAGLAPVTWSEGLARAAGQHLEVMRKQGTLAHQFAGEADLPDRVAACGVRFTLVSENIGEAEDAEELQGLWMESPEHRENMLNPITNSVGIALLESGRSLWAVEDFSHTIPELTLDQQETQVSHLLLLAGIPATASDAARAMCSLESGYVGRRPAFVMRFQSGELTQLPQALLIRLQRGKVASAAVGACTLPGAKFSLFRIAVALYP